MKMSKYLRRSLSCCHSTTSISTTTTTTTSIPSPTPTIKNRLSSTLTDIFKPNNHHQEPQDPDQDQDSLIDAAASFTTTTTTNQTSPLPRHYHHHPHRSTIVGTIYGRRRGHVRLCFQSDPSIPPPFLFHLSVPTHHLAREMNSGLLRVALECHREQVTSAAARQAPVWKAYCNGRRVGYAMRRKPSERDKEILRIVKTMTAGAGVLSFNGGEMTEREEGEDNEGELLYMRASYERVVGSRDSVSYHLINPGGGGGRSPGQELSVFLLRTTG